MAICVQCKSLQRFGSQYHGTYMVVVVLRAAVYLLHSSVLSPARVGASPDPNLKIENKINIFIIILKGGFRVVDLLTNDNYVLC